MQAVGGRAFIIIHHCKQSQSQSEQIQYAGLEMQRSEKSEVEDLAWMPITVTPLRHLHANLHCLRALHDSNTHIPR